MSNGVIGASRTYAFGAPERTKERRVCWRCGVAWRDVRAMYNSEAPCRDCRDVLADEGVDINSTWLRPGIINRGRRRAA